MVPYEGLVPDSEIFGSGTKLETALKNLIVIDHYFYPKDPRSIDCIHVFDGQHRVRKITFNTETYAITSDEVIAENINFPEDFFTAKEELGF